MCKHFDMYRFRVNELQNFWEKANIDYQEEALNQGSMYALPLRSVIGHILEMHSLRISHL